MLCWKPCGTLAITISNSNFVSFLAWISSCGEWEGGKGERTTLNYIPAAVSRRNHIYLCPSKPIIILNTQSIYKVLVKCVGDVHLLSVSMNDTGP